jgi:anti-anti-sigma regulatory factor
LEGRISSTNANQVEKEILAQVDAQTVTELVLDAADLEYISSAASTRTTLETEYPETLRSVED